MPSPSPLEQVEPAPQLRTLVVLKGVASYRETHVRGHGNIGRVDELAREVVRTLYYARDYERAIQQARNAMQLEPNYCRTNFWLGRVYAQKHMYKEAIAESEIVLKATPDSNLGLTEMAYRLALAGRQAEARAILRRLEDRKKNSFVPAYNWQSFTSP